jgi:hypothetical protein
LKSAYLPRKYNSDYSFAATKQQHSKRYSAIYFNRKLDSIADKAAFILLMP